jgi:alkylation response protein AidB-like acyl-CoA dehydrogenase
MDFDFAPEEQAFRREVRSWLEAHLPPDLKGTFAFSRADRERVERLRAWQRALYEGGWVGLNWPVTYGGRGASIVEQVIFYEELARAQAPPPINRGGLGMLGPTLMKYGTEAQVRRFLPKILTAEELWCQGFSEPNAGSDLANLQTRAERDGEHFVVNGQKVWTSLAHLADWGFFLVRTDPAAPKHKGITFLLVDMKTSGITVKPLRQMTGEAEFNEVFLDNVRVPVANVVGEVNRGWEVAITTLAYERDVLTFMRSISLRMAVDRLLDLARKTRRDGGRAADDPMIRQRLVSLLIQEKCLQLNGYRSLTRLIQGAQPGPEGSTAKLVWSQVDQEVAELAMEMLGLGSQITEGPWATDGGQWAYNCLLVRASTLRAGTSEILKNILGERVLSLPKD